MGSPVGNGIGAGMDQAFTKFAIAIGSLGVGTVAFGSLGRLCFQRTADPMKKIAIAVATLGAILSSPIVLPRAYQVAQTAYTQVADNYSKIMQVLNIVV